jgi:hypothetical protein
MMYLRAHKTMRGQVCLCVFVCVCVWFPPRVGLCVHPRVGLFFSRA